MLSFNNEKIRDVSARVLNGLDVKKDVKRGFVFVFRHFHALTIRV